MTAKINKEEDLFIADILSRNKFIAIVGASKNWKRPSNFVMKHLHKNGYKVIPVNPSTPGKEISAELIIYSITKFLSG